MNAKGVKAYSCCLPCAASSAGPADTTETPDPAHRTGLIRLTAGPILLTVRPSPGLKMVMQKGSKYILDACQAPMSAYNADHTGPNTQAG